MWIRAGLLIRTGRKLRLTQQSHECQRFFSVNRSTDKADDELPKYDLVVNGGGLVGLSFLAALQKSRVFDDKRILLLEQGKRKPNSFSQDNQERKFSNRVSALTPGSKEFFESLGIWSIIEPYAKEVKVMHVWARNFKDGITFSPANPGLIDSICSQNNDPEDHICHVVENWRILDALISVVDQEAIKYESSLTDYSANGNNVDVTVNGEEKLNTSLLVGCDGFNSLVRQKSTLKYFEQPLDQKAVVATVEIESSLQGDLNDVGFQRFIPNISSVLAILPLTERVSSIVFSGPSNVTAGLMDREETDFVDTLNQLLFTEELSHGEDFLTNTISKLDSLINSALPFIKAAQLPRYNPPQISSVDPGSRAMFPLVFGTTMPYLVGSPAQSNIKKVVLIGDAAHRVHPLAGQGLNLGLGDAEVLASNLTSAIKRGEDLFGDQPENLENLKSALYKFEGSRQIKLIPMMAAIHSMQHVFNYAPSTCMRAFNHLSGIKNEIVRFANTN